MSRTPEDIFTDLRAVEGYSVPDDGLCVSPWEQAVAARRDRVADLWAELVEALPTETPDWASYAVCVASGTARESARQWRAPLGGAR